MFKNIIFNTLGIILYAIGIHCFAAPHNIAPGGASGIAIIVNYLCGFPIGLFNLLFNIPLLGLIWIKEYFPKKFILKILLTTVFLSLATDVLVVRFPVYKGDTLLAALFAGGLMGVGLALVHVGQSNTGGISLVAVIIQKFKSQLQVGSVVCGLNIIVIACSSIIYKNIESLLYATVTVYLSGIFMDKWVNTMSAKNLMIIMSGCTDTVREILIASKKEITILQGQGGYTSKEQRVILCAATKEDCEEIEKDIKKVDNQSLIIVTQATRVYGKNFKHVI